MTKAFEDIFLWGHSLDAYIKMFLLTESELKQKLLDCCGGPTSFNAELSARGGKVVSVDPLFAEDPQALKNHIDKIFAEMLAAVESNRDRFVWERYQSPQELAKVRQKNIALFLKDYPQGLKENRYIGQAPPQLHFDHFQFDIALCSHYLFANSPQHTEEYHLASIQNICDVAKELRIFPLLDSKGEIPDLVGPVTQGLHAMGFGVEIKAVPYQFQKKGNAMLRVWAQTCEV